MRTFPILISIFVALWVFSGCSPAHKMLRLVHRQYGQFENGRVEYKEYFSNEYMGDTTVTHTTICYQHLRYPVQSIFATRYLQYFFKPTGNPVVHLYNREGWNLIYPNGEYLSSGRLGGPIRQRSRSFRNAPFLNPRSFFGTLKQQRSKQLVETEDYYWIQAGIFQLWVRKQDSLINRFLIYEETPHGVHYDDFRFLSQDFNQPAYAADSLYELPQGSKVPIPEAPKDESPGPLEGQVLRDWTLPSATGDSVSLRDLRGKIVIIDWWYEGCRPCLEAMPHLQALQDRYGARGLQVVGINPVNKLSPNSHPFLVSKGIHYPALYSGQVDPYLPEAYQVNGFYPTVHILNREGKLVKKIRGYTPLSMKSIEREISLLLEE